MHKDKPKPAPKRSWKETSFKKCDGGISLLLDGKYALTPKRRPLAIPNQSVADAVKREYDIQGERINADSMPFTRYCTIAIDVIRDDRAQVVDDTVSYGATDLLCYRSEEAALQALQQTQWQPVLEWLQATHSVTLQTTHGIMPVAQSDNAMAILQALVEAMDDYTLAAFSLLVRVTGSLALSFAVLEEFIPAQEAVALSQLDENYQTDLWGEDGEKQEKLKALATEISAIGRYLSLLKT